MYSQTTHGVTIDVSPKYLADQSTPDNARWFWAYTITISNKRNDAVQLRRRFWRITNALGKIEVVDSPGVVGEEPIIEAGQQFQYTSGCPLDTPSGTMQGHYVLELLDGSYFNAAIPPFSLDLPNAARTLN